MMVKLIYISIFKLISEVFFFPLKTHLDFDFLQLNLTAKHAF